MHCSVFPVLEVGFKFNLGVVFAESLVRDDVQAQPFGFYTPLHQFGGIEECLLYRNGGGNDVVDDVQDVSTVSGAHEGFGGGRQDSAKVQWAAAAGIACA